MKDLVILVADKNIEFALRGALGRHKALAIRSISCEFRAHMGRDGGARSSGVEILALERRRFAHALLVFDLEGCGVADGEVAVELEARLDAKLSLNWGDCAKTIVIAPESDVWVWGSDNALRDAVGWHLTESPRNWLKAKGFGFDVEGKPERPKEALEAMLIVHRRPRSSALYEHVTSRISLKHCTDPAFKRLHVALRSWFS